MASSLPDGLVLGPVVLTVTDIDRAVAFYTDVIGLRLARRDEDAASGAAVAVLGDGAEERVVLVEDQAAAPLRRGAGLYHVALLYPSRAELARAAVRLAVSQTPIQGASDHGTHEAIYLADPDGNGLELAADRPRSEWPDVRSPAGYAGGPQPLDTQALLDVVAGEEPTRFADPGVRVGHVHLHVGDIERGLAFYRDLLGFDEMVNLGSAAFVSAGGYHHHLGFNVWRTPSDAPVPDGVVGLREWTILLPDASDVARVRARLEDGGVAVEDRAATGGFLARDPWGIPVVVTS